MISLEGRDSGKALERDKSRHAEADRMDDGIRKEMILIDRT